MFEIKEAVATDMPSVLKLIQELAEFEKEPEAVEVTINDLCNDYKAQRFNCLVAMFNDVVVGMALFYYRYSTWKGKTIHLEDLIVTENFRGKGIGKALLDTVVDKAKKENLRRVEWNVLDWNIPAIDFYKGVGATVFNNWLVVQLDEKGIQNY